MAMVPHSSGDYFMSKITTKVVMCAVLMGASAGQIFASDVSTVDQSNSKKRSCLSYLNVFRSCMREAVNDVREAAPVVHEVITAGIEVSKVVATVQGDDKLVRTLDKAQDVLDGTLELTQANNVNELLDAGKDIVGVVDPKDVSKIGGALDKVEEVADALKPIIDAAVASAGANHV